MKRLSAKILITSLLSLATALFAGACLSACRKGGVGTDGDGFIADADWNGSLYGQWNEYEGVKVGFAGEAAYGKGDVDERGVLPELDCKKGEKFYMIADFQIRAPYDYGGGESVTAEVRVQPSDIVAVTIQETPTGNVTEETVDGVTRLRATYAIPNSSATVRDVRLVIQFTATGVGLADVGLTFENPASMQAVETEKIEKTARIGCAELLYERTVAKGTYVLGIADKTVEKAVIPCIYGGEYVVGVGDGAFADCTEMTEVCIPRRVTAIGEYAFGACANLVDAALPEKLISLGKRAFYGCEKLKRADVPVGVTEIGEEAFEECLALESITVAEDNGKFLGKDGILYDKPATKFLHIPKSVSGVVDIPDGVTNIDNFAFSGRGSLTGVIIPNGVKALGSHAFRDCGNLKEVNLPDGVTSIGDWAFSGCAKLEALTIPESVESIGWLAFGGCDLLHYNEENGLKYLGSESNGFAFLITADYSVTECAVNARTKIIYDSAFANCGRLERVTLPDGLEQIGERAFSGCAITEIVIPDGVKKLGEAAFRNCSYLESITVSAQTKTGEYILEHCSAIKSITFKGTQAQWNEVMIYFVYNSQAKNYVVHCTDGDIER